MKSPIGKYVQIDENNPDAVGRCDYSGFMFNRRDLVKQMEWRGNALVWTGFYVGRPFADTPNEQLRPPILPPDPVPILYPRLPQGSIITWSVGQNSIWRQIQVDSWVDWYGSSDGIPAIPESQRLQLLQNYNWGTG